MSNENQPTADIGGEGAADMADQPFPASDAPPVEHEPHDLTPDELAGVERAVTDGDSPLHETQEGNWLASMAFSMVAEILRRRAQPAPALSEDERDALTWLRPRAEAQAYNGVEAPRRKRALDALDRILAPTGAAAAVPAETMPKCARSACAAEAYSSAIHRDTGARYCIPCARRINEACGEQVVPWTVPEDMRDGDIVVHGGRAIMATGTDPATGKATSWIVGPPPAPVYHDDVNPDPAEVAYWHFDALRAGRGRGPYLRGSPMEERQAFKSVWLLLAAARPQTAPAPRSAEEEITALALQLAQAGHGEKKRVFPAIWLRAARRAYELGARACTPTVGIDGAGCGLSHPPSGSGTREP